MKQLSYETMNPGNNKTMNFKTDSHKNCKLMLQFKIFCVG